MKKLLLLILLLTFSIGQSQTPPAGPSTPPARNSWDVLSQYGSTYTNEPGVIFDSFGGSNIVGDVVLGDASVVKKYLAHSYSGIKVNGAGDLNVSGMTHLHMDVWSPDFVSFKVKLEGTNGSNNEIEVPFAKNQGTWNSYDIPLSTYVNTTLSNLRWIVPVTFDPNNTTLYITNVYFYRPATTQPPTLGAFTVPAQLVGAPNVTITPPTTNSAGAFSYTSSNTAVAQVVNGNELQIIGGGTSTITANQAAAAPYGSGSAIATLTVSYPAPGPSPTPPARAPGTVVSNFTGGDYTDPVPAMVRAPWTAGTTLSTIPNGANTCLQVDNLGYLGYITPGANYSAAGMTKLHVDIYLNTPIANMFIFLLSNGDQLYNTGALVAGWNSLDITLASAYPGANLADIYGFKFEHNQGAARQIYLDNIYFYVSGSDPTITDFTVPAKVFGDADFAITPPTSNSAGAFSYTSSNTSVATIVGGNQIHIVGIGSSTITANQAANGIYDAGSITASLVVAAPPLATPAPNPPARNAWDVVSLYSDAYTTVPSAVWVGASTLTDEVLGGNPTKKMSNFIVEFINSAPIDVSEMTMLHMDIYALDVTGFNIWLLNNGDRRAQISTPINGWRSIDIPMSTYSSQGLNLTGINQLKFEGLSGPGTTAYVDNVYYYRPATLPPATVGMFTVPAKNVGDANFTITPPTSNNTSPFVYSSNNSAIATIVGGNQIQVGTGGTCTITASQVSDGTYGPTLRTATFVVSFPAPGASPIPPVRLPATVKSLYSAAYATVSGFDMVRAFWTAGTTMTTVPNGADTALRVDNLGYIGLIDTTERRLNVSDMTTLHLDVYVDAPFANLFFWLLTDGDQRRDITNLVAGWNSITINLSEFAGANLSNVYGFKFEQNQPSPLRFYLDNVYFSNETVYADTDGDGFGDLASSAIGAQPGYVSNSTDCDDTNILVWRTGNFYEDADNDGYYNGNPTAVSVCYGATTPSGYTASILAADCNDNNFEINPGHVEVLNNGIDDNCSGPEDETLVDPTSFLYPSVCGTTMSSLYQVLYANQVAGAQGYRFEITNGSTIRTIDNTLNNFTFAQLTGTNLYATAYSVRVAVKMGGFFRAYGTSCVVNTPLVPSVSKIYGCGSTLASFWSTIYASPVAAATGYRFRVTNGSNVRTFDTTVSRFSLAQLTGTNLYGTTYTVEVALRFGTTWAAEYSPACNFTTTATPPTTKVVASQCGITISNLWATIYANPSSDAVSYRFEVVNGAQTRFFDTPNPRFSLQQLAGGAAANTVYTVRVAIFYGGVYQAFGTPCTITTSPTATRGAATDLAIFEANAYPNPFADTFKLDINTSSEDTVEVKVYDMIGKLVERRNISLTELGSQEVGSKFTSGVYNIVITQGENVKTLRVIKR